MAASLRISTAGVRAVEAKLAALVSTFGDLTPLMHHLGGVLETQTDERFESETAPDGTPWKPSARAKKDGRKTLQDRVILRPSIHSVAGNSAVEIGTNLIYAGVHQNGFAGTVTVPAHMRTIEKAFGIRLKTPVSFTVKSFEREMKMPKREFIGISGDNDAELIEETEDFVASEMGGLS